MNKDEEPDLEFEPECGQDALEVESEPMLTAERIT